MSKSEFWFCYQKKVASLLAAPLNHQDLSLSFHSFCLSDSFVFSVLHKSSSIPIAVANDRLSVLIALPTFTHAYETLT